MPAEKKEKTFENPEPQTKIKQPRLFRAMFWPLMAVATILVVAGIYQFIIPRFNISWMEDKKTVSNNQTDIKNQPGDNNAPANQIKKTPNNNLFVTVPESMYATTSLDHYTIYGVNSDSASEIRVIFKNESAGLSADYLLSNFNAGDHNWNYSASIENGNMGVGTNTYEISLQNNGTVLDTDIVTIDLVDYPAKITSTTVAWFAKLKQLPKNGEYGTTIHVDGDPTDYMGDLYEAGTITSGEYKGQILYSFAESTMGFVLDYLIKKDDDYWKVSTLNLQIVNLDNLPAETTIPATSYTLKKSDWAAGFSNSFFIDKVVFRNNAVGPLYLTCRQGDGVKSCDAKSCLMAELPDHTMISYDFDLPFLTEDKPIDIVFNDGTKNTSTYRFITPTCDASCRQYSVVTMKDLIATDNLKVAGKDGGEVFYEPANKNSKDYLSLYNDNFTIAYQTPDGMSTTSKYTYSEFLKMHPVLFWKDPIGRWIRFVSSNFDTLAEMCKPVVYLYPQKDIDVSVKVAPNGGMSFSNPLYNDGWNVLARPNGKLTNSDNKDYSYLFWEGIGINLPWPNEGFVVKQGELKNFFQDSLAKLSLNETEIKDFNDYWIGRLQGSNYWQISFIDQPDFEKIAPLNVNPTPDTVIRVMMYAKPLAKPIDLTKQVLKGKARVGFTVVEWGGAAFDKP
jgi:hypothetical protein